MTYQTEIQISQKILLIHDLTFLFLTKVTSNTVSHFSDRKGCALNHNYIFLLNFLTGWLTDSCYFIEKASLLKNQSFPKAGTKLSCIYLIKRNNENQFHKVQVLRNHVVCEILLLRWSFSYFTWNDAKNYYCWHGWLQVNTKCNETINMMKNCKARINC